MTISRASLLLLASIAALLLLGGGTAPAGSTQKVYVVDGDGVAATFAHAQCRKRKGSFSAKATSSDGRFGLVVQIDAFSGFHTYEMAFGPNADPYVVFYERYGDGPRYSNLFQPSYPVAGGGQVRFANRGKTMGVGFSPTFSHSFNEGVDIAGVLKCRFPGRKN